ncbi:MAG: LAGLIDADG family homing endonuclease [archaeon]|nr:LAGLIDADG family homing endonuclease [archaeon]
MRADTESKTEFQSTGGKFSRKFAKKDVHPFDELNWMKRDCTIANPDGSVVFSLKDIEVPTTWGQLSFDIAVSKYFKRAGIPKTGHEISVKQLVYRVAHTYRVKGEQFGYFNSKTDADAFEEDLTFLLVNQFAAFNSPVWFNVGLNEVHGIKGKADNYHYFPEKQKVERVDTYEFPQCSACFIQSLTDDLDSIFELIKNESRLFKYGSGTGTNFSKLRGKGEKLSGGGSSSGLISFLEVLDRGAGATKSGGITRRAAKMVMLDMDHPDIEEFITWKTREEDKALALIRAGYSSDFNGEAYKTVSGQNSNNSVRIPHKFMEAYLNNSKWQTFFRTNNQLAKEYDAKYLMDQIAHSAWRCADPGVQFDDTMNEWHTCPNNDKIRATNPCVTGDTLVLTKNNGWQRIDSLINKETEIVTNLNEMSIGLTNGSFETGIKPVYKLTTNSGYELKLTADHKVFTANRGFVEAIELTKDDFVCIPSTQVNAIIEPKEKEFFQLLGVYLGDGSGSGGVIQITMDKAEENILQTIAAYCSTAFEKQTYQNRGTMVVQTATSSKINIASSKAIERISQFVDLTQKSFEKTISEKIFSLSLGEQKYILQGLFTTDGTVANYGEKSQYVALDSTSHELIKGVQLMLLGFGIKSKIYSNRRAGKLTSMLPDGKGGIKEYNVKEMHSLRISRSSRILFQQLIGFMQESNKNNQLAELNSSISTYEDKPFDAVKSLEYIGEKKVYDLTEMFSHSFIANGISVHNCSEYVFIDDTACNLASLNLMKYLKEDGIFDVESFRNAIKIIFTAQEISVAMSSFPTESIAKNSYDYRTIGLGYANLGTMLMVSGIPYDSDKGRAIAGAITAIMTGHAYKVSAEIAEKVGSFTHFEKNREPMLKVMNKHRDEAYKIDETLCPKYLIKAAEEDWDNAVLLGEKFGYRNAQATVLAPTGTIGLLMDCDTTGVEPEFAIVKWKKLAGGGYFKIVNQSILLALQRLEYNDIQIKEMLDYV